MGLVFGFLVFVVLIIASFVIVGSVVLVSFGRGVKRLIVGPRSASPVPRIATAPLGCACDRADCMANNPEYAQFCRRCGEPLAGVARRRSMKVA